MIDRHVDRVQELMMSLEKARKAALEKSKNTGKQEAVEEISHGE